MTTSTLTPTPTAELEALAACYPQGKEHASIILPQLQHRLNLAAAWGISPGNRVLDIGCGQGDSVVGLAHAVGPTGRVVGIDPASPEYGAPLTLGQAQAFILQSALGERISFARATAPEFLALALARPDQNTEAEAGFDAATLCHSLWYFDGPEDVSALFAALGSSAGPRSPRTVCIAEWAGQARTPAQKPHELAVQAQRLLHTVTATEANVRSALPPAELLALAVAQGFTVRAQGSLAPPKGMLDGSWEVASVLAPSFAESVSQLEAPQETKDEILALVTETRAAKDAVGKVCSMDVFWAVLE